MEVVKGPSSGKAEDGEPFVCGVDVADADGADSGLGWVHVEEGLKRDARWVDQG